MIAEATDEELLTVARATWRATPHPLLRWASDDELVAALRQPDGHALLDALFKEREERIALSLDDGDPLRYGFELANWKDADELLRDNKLVYVAGGKRASKSEWAAKRVMQAALAHGKSVIWCFQDNVRTSISTQQKLIWKFLPPELKRFNGKEDRRKVFKISYTPANGFANSILVLPNRTEIHFLTYNQDVKEFQGWEIGANVASGESGLGSGEELPPNIGAWADENLTLPWLETLDFRSTTRNAKILWTFSTTEGITTTIKEVLGAAETLKSRFAELLPERVNVPGLPVGHMPYVQRCQRKSTAAIYFFTEFNVFGDNYSGVKALCQGRPSHYIEENAYGYARDVMHKAFPLFGEWNVVDPKNIPAKGTNYMFTDPAGARNWATLWVRVTPGNPGKFYIYRDWPDAQSYGEWAVASDDPAQPDGKAGSAQRSLGLGVEQMKALWRSLECAGMTALGTARHVSPAESGVVPPHSKETIFQRFIDPRAGRNPHANEHGGTCLVDQFADGENPMLLTPASGVDVERGLSVVNDLLWWDNTKPMDMLTNAPRLFVSRECKQVLWMMNNYTGRGGEKAGAKDFADLLRYMALAELEHYDDTTLRSLGGGSY